MSKKKLSCAILQPHYLPWMGYFEMIDRVDRFVIYDDVQFIQREWKNRNRIRKDPISSAYKWISVPVTRSSKRNTSIKDVEIAYPDTWFDNHINAIKTTYYKCPFYEEVSPEIFSLLSQRVTSCPLNAATLPASIPAGPPPAISKVFRLDVNLSP